MIEAEEKIKKATELYKEKYFDLSRKEMLIEYARLSNEIEYFKPTTEEEKDDLELKNILFYILTRAIIDDDLAEIGIEINEKDEFKRFYKGKWLV